jgi:hypothetical protein
MAEIIYPLIIKPVKWSMTWLNQDALGGIMIEVYLYGKLRRFTDNLRESVQFPWQWRGRDQRRFASHQPDKNARTHRAAVPVRAVKVRALAQACPGHR